jgi:AcrR family transcriptional regulator
MPKPTFFNLPEDKRARIVELAIDEFAMHPFAEASLSRIVARAGIAKGSVYQYFDDKLDVYRWLLFDVVGEGKRAHAAAAAGGDLFTRLEAQCVAGLSFFRDNPRLARLALRAVEPAAEPALMALHDEVRRAGRAALAAEIRAAKRRGEVRPDVDVGLAALALAALLGPVLMDAVLESLGVDIVTLLREPHRARALSGAKQQRIVRQLLALVAQGLSATADPGGVLI